MSFRTVAGWSVFYAGVVLLAFFVLGLDGSWEFGHRGFRGQQPAWLIDLEPDVTIIGSIEDPDYRFTFGRFPTISVRLALVLVPAWAMQRCLRARWTRTAPSNGNSLPVGPA